jgi:hypothetical protein
VGHFTAMLSFAALASLALACIAQKSTAARIRFAAISFVLFMAIGIGIAWLMYPFSR